MQIESLKTYCDLAETQSFTKAAHINRVTQSAVSQTIGALEKEFKSLLVERSKKNFRLTIEGEMVYDFSRRILQTFGAIESKMQELKQELSGQIRVAAVYSIGLHALPPYVKRFLKDYPAVNLHVQYRHEHQVLEDVGANLVDLGLVAFPPRDPQLEVVPLREEPLVLVCAPEHPLAKQKTVKLKALAGLEFISFEPGIPTRKALDRIFRQARVSVKHVREYENIETLKGAVELGAGIAILPETTVAPELERKTLVAVKLAGKYRRPIGAIYKKGKLLSPASKRFIELLKEAL